MLCIVLYFHYAVCCVCHQCERCLSAMKIAAVSVDFGSLLIIVDPPKVS